MFGAFYLEHST